MNETNIYVVNYLPPANKHCMFLHPSDDSEVFKYLKFKKNASPGHKEIHCRVVKVMACFIARPLCHIINLSLKHGFMATDLKVAQKKKIERITLDQFLS